MAKAKGKRLTKKVSKKNSGSDDIRGDDIDVASEEHLKGLKDLMSKHPVVVLFIYADWCGHCTTFKPTWDKYKNINGRKVPIARINEKMLAKSPAADAKIDGFPSVVVRGNDGSFADFKKESGEATHSVPNIRDEDAMTKMLKTDPSKLLAAKASRSEVPTANAESLLAESGRRAIKNRNMPGPENDSPVPPNINDDMTGSKNNDLVPPPLPPKPTMGGSLYRSLVQAVKGIKSTFYDSRRGARRHRARSMKKLM